MFERPMKSDPAFQVSLIAMLLPVWGFLFLGSWIKWPETVFGAMACITFIATAAICSVVFAHWVNHWCKSTPKWKLVRDRLDQANGG